MIHEVLVTHSYTYNYLLFIITNRNIQYVIINLILNVWEINNISNTGIMYNTIAQYLINKYLPYCQRDICKILIIHKMSIFQ